LYAKTLNMAHSKHLKRTLSASQTPRLAEETTLL